MIFRVTLLFVCLLSSANLASAAEYYFPIIASGFIPGSSDQFYVTEFVINNSGTRTVNASLLLFSPQGDLLDVTIRNAATSSTQQDSIFQMTIPANGAWRGYIVE